MSTGKSKKSGIFGLDFQTEETLYQASLYISGIIMTLFGVFPIYWMAQNAFKTRSAVLDGPTWLPSAESFTVQNFDILFSGDVGLYLLNTIVVTVGTIIAVVVISMLAGYGMARFRWRQKENFARFLLFGYMFSPIVLGLPLYLIWKSIGLLNTRIGLIVALTAISMPFSVWLMWKYIQTIPEAQEESAWIAGASRWRGFRDVIVPQTQPGMIAAALFAFALAWNDFTFAQILLPRNEATTFAPRHHAAHLSGVRRGLERRMAVSLLMTVPPLLFAYFLQGYLLKGFEIRSL